MKNVFVLFITFTLIFITEVHSQEWEIVGETPFSRNHALGFSFDGKGYLLTGGSPGRSAEFWEYNPDDRSWKRLPDYPGPRRGVAMGDDWNGKYYFGFGTGDGGKKLTDLWVYDPLDTSFTELPSCPCTRRTHPAFIADNDKVYIVAGSGPDGNLNDFWIYDMITQEWERKADIPGRRHHPFFFEIDHEIYVGGGHNKNWYRYDMSTDSWIQINSMLGGRVAGAQFDYGGKGYVVSGEDTDHKKFETGEFWEYDPATDSWTELPPHDGASIWAPAQFVLNDYIYVLTGYVGAPGTTSPIYRYPLRIPTDTKDESPQKAVYPVPFDNELTLSDYLYQNYKEGRLMLNDIVGNLAFETILDKQSYDLSFLPNGVYVLKLIHSDKEEYVEKLMKN